MKKSELIFNVISVPVDLFMIWAAATLAYFLRYKVEAIPVIFDLSYHQYLGLVALPVLFLLLLLALSGLYTQKATRGFWREAGKVTTTVSAALMIVVVLFFFNQRLFPSRLIILMNWIFIIVLVSFTRAILLLLQRQLLKRGQGLHRLVVIQGANHNPLVEEIKNDKTLGYQIVQIFDYHEAVAQELEELHRRERIDELLQADTRLSNEQVLVLVNLCEELGIKFNYLPSILETHRAHIETDVIGSMPVIRLKNTPLDGWGKVVKRIMDIVAASVGLILFSPLFFLISLAIKLDTRGPVFFHHRRGSSFHSFEFYKFRTMYQDLSEGTPRGDDFREELEQQNVRGGPYVKVKNDPRVTRIGRFLRKTKLDELPQFWHILRGEMSLVGPRIHMTTEVEKFEEHYKKIFSTVKPGATGLAQINQMYNSELPFEEETKLDLFYIENWSVWLDVYIILKTIVLVLTKRPEADY